MSAGARPDTWMPFYVGDYLRDTMHLSPAEHGAYLLLICHYWISGKPVLDDDNVLRRVARMTTREWDVSRETLAAFFTVADGYWLHKRVDRELVRSRDLTYERSKAGSKGAANRWQGHKQNDAPSQSQDSIAKSAIESGAQVAPTDAGKAPKSNRGTRLPSDWEPSAEDRAFADEHGFRNGTCDALVAEFRDYWAAVPGWRGLKLNWSSTFRNRVRQKATPGVANGRAEKPKRGGTAEIIAGLADAFGDCIDDGRGRDEADQSESPRSQVG